MLRMTERPSQQEQRLPKDTRPASVREAITRNVATFLIIMLVALILALVSMQGLAAHIQLRGTLTTILLVCIIAPPILGYFARQNIHNKQLVAEVTRAAMTDPATGLLNRVGFKKELDRAVRLYSETGAMFMLVLVDLDHFKGVNDRHGHDAGDAVLKTIGRRITSLPRCTSVSRMGGDEFAVLIDVDGWEGMDCLDVFQDTFSKALDHIFRPITLGKLELDITGSAGSSIYSRDAQSASELRQNADAALMTAKRDGRAKHKIFNDEIDAASGRRRLLEQSIPVGTKKTALEAAYQPIFCVQTKRLVGVEMLARWQHDTLGYIPPPEFLTVAQECGFGSEMNANLQVLACEEMSSWLAQGRLENLSLNVSPLDFATNDFAERVLERLAAYNIDPAQIWIEVIETTKVTDLRATRENLETLRAAGVRIALDDYGSGYSNIHAIMNLPLDRIKVDKSVIAGLVNSPELYAFFRSSVQLAHSLGAEIVAEGVETEAQLALVKAAGCELVQGYLLAKPLSKTDLEPVLETAKTAELDLRA